MALHSGHPGNSIARIPSSKCLSLGIGIDVNSIHALGTLNRFTNDSLQIKASKFEDLITDGADAVVVVDLMSPGSFKSKATTKRHYLHVRTYMHLAQSRSVC